MADLTAAEILAIKAFDQADRPLSMFYTTFDDWADRFPAVVIPDPRNVPPNWIANFAYTDRVIISALDPIDGLTYLWENDGIGTSDSTIPVLDHTTSPVTDNDLTWTLIGLYTPD
jgi:hypothetical protein